VLLSPNVHFFAAIYGIFDIPVPLVRLGQKQDMLVSARRRRISSYKKKPEVYRQDMLI
jgi:hypothetical protein